MGKKNLPKSERVAIWNSFLHLARNATALLANGRAGSPLPRGGARSGGRLSEEQEVVLTALTFCTLAIEARVNHLLEEQFEEERITRALCDAVLRLPPQHKWFLLPKIAGRRAIAQDQPPHQSVAEICRRRNALVHVDYARLSDNMPTPTEMVQLFRGFIMAMEDMNIVLGRAKHRRKAVDDLARL